MLKREVFIVRRTLTDAESGANLRVEFGDADPADAKPGVPVNMMPVYAVTIDEPTPADMATYVRGNKFILSVEKA